MDDIIIIEVCTGVDCFMVGGADLLELENYLPEELLDNVQIESAECMGYCTDEYDGQPPYVRVNGEIMSDASIDDVIREIKSLLGE